MNRYFRRFVQVLEARIGRINNSVKCFLERAAVSNTVAALLWAVVALCAGVSFWQSPEAWLGPIRKQADRIARLYRAIEEQATALLDHVAKDPIGASIFAIIQHPLFLKLIGLLVVLRVVYVWIMEEGAATAHVRQIAVRLSIKLTGPKRVHLFAHRLASVAHSPRRASNVSFVLSSPCSDLWRNSFDGLGDSGDIRVKVRRPHHRVRSPYHLGHRMLPTTPQMRAAQWSSLRSLIEEVRDNTLSRSRMCEAEQCLQFLDSVVDHHPERVLPIGNWLQHYIRAAFARKLCIEIGCGLCGSTPFKSGLVQLASGGLHQDVVDVGQNALKEIASALAQIPLDTQLGDTLHDSDRVIMSIIYFLWSKSRGFRRDIEPVLNGSWAGQVLKRMQAHYVRVQAERHAHDAMNDPRYVQHQRALRKAERQLRHAARLARKRGAR